MSEPSVPRVVALALAAVLTACAAKNPPGDIVGTDLFSWAQERFDDEDYSSARNGFQTFLLRDPLSPLMDSAQFMLAEAQLRLGDELSAAEEFSRLATGRPNSAWADDAQFGVCRAYLAAAPKVDLSQEYAERAIVACERLMQFFPASELRETAEQMLSRARSRLAEKSLAVGKYYFGRRLYESANVYFEKAISEQPGLAILPELLALMYASYTKVGFDTEARAVQERLLREFPDSEEAVRAREGGGDAN